MVTSKVFRSTLIRVLDKRENEKEINELRYPYVDRNWLLFWRNFDCFDVLLWWVPDTKLRLSLFFAMLTILLAILKFCIDQRQCSDILLWWVPHAKFSSYYVSICSNVPHYPHVLYWSTTILTYYSYECLTWSFSLYYASLYFRFSSPSLNSVSIKYSSDVFLLRVPDSKLNSIYHISLCFRFSSPSSSSVTI